MDGLLSMGMPVRAQAATRGVAIIVGLCALALVVPSAGLAARLVGGRTQQAIARAFTAQRTHRGQVVVSIRTSTVNGSWAVVRSVTPQSAGLRRVRHCSTYPRISLISAFSV